jgi:hypothetical protein
LHCTSPKWPEADIHGAASLDYLVGAGLQRERDSNTQRLGGFEVDGELEFGWLLDRQVGRHGTFENPARVAAASLFTSELEVKKLALLRELVPQAPLIAMLVNPINPSGNSASVAHQAAGQDKLTKLVDRGNRRNRC